jgi:ketosteroid isomerase-like protein
MSLSPPKAHQLAQSWIEAWNRRDLEAVLSHYAEDIEFSSPFVANPKVAGDPSGRLKGKEKLRAYFQSGLDLLPNLKMALVDVLVGVDGYTMVYRRESGVLVADVMILNDAFKAVRAQAYYARGVS